MPSAAGSIRSEFWENDVFDEVPHTGYDCWKFSIEYRGALLCLCCGRLYQP